MVHPQSQRSARCTEFLQNFQISKHSMASFSRRPSRPWTIDECALFAARKEFELLKLLSTDKKAMAAARRLGHHAVLPQPLPERLPLASRLRYRRGHHLLTHHRRQLLQRNQTLAGSGVLREVRGITLSGESSYAAAVD